MSQRGEDWKEFSEQVHKHIEVYTVPQYGDKGEDQASEYGSAEHILQAKRYLSRYGKNNISAGSLELIEAAGRTCYKSEEHITSDSAPKFAEMILKRGHESVLEHASATVRFICDRGVTHEIVRHRLASYSQESTRYCDYNGGEVTFVIPPWCIGLKEKQYTSDVEKMISDTLNEISDSGTQCWLISMADAESAYKNLRMIGWRPEQARSVLPNSLKTEIVMTANLREWRHFFKLRTSAAAHPQMREVAVPLLVAMKLLLPVIFDDILL